MSACCKKFKFVHFADDTTVFLEGLTLNDLYDDVNFELVQLDAWLSANRLSLNIDKTIYLVHSNRDRNSVKQIAIRNKFITKVN